MRIDAIVNKTNMLSFLTLIVLLSACSPKAAQVRPEEQAKAVSISSLEIGKSDDKSILTIKATESLQGNYTVIKVSDPPKVVIEMPTADVGNFEGTIDAVNGVISKVTTSRRDVSGAMIEISLLSLVEHEVKADGNTLEIYLVAPQEEAAPSEKVEEAPIEKAEAGSTPDEKEQSPAEIVVEPKTEEKAEPPKKAIKVKAVEIKKEGKFTRAEIITDGEISDYNVFDLKSPARVVVDVRNAREILAKREIKAVSPHINGARLGRHDGQVRVVFDYKGSVKPYDVVKENDRISILFGKRPETVVAKIEKAAVKEEAPKIEEMTEVEKKPETAAVEPEPAVIEAGAPVEMKTEEAPQAKAEAIPSAEEQAQTPAEIVEEPKKEERAEAPKKALRIKDVKIKKSGKFTSAEIITDGDPSTYKVYDLKSPDRVIVDIMNARDISVKKNIKAVSPHIKGARLGRHDGQVRVVFDYKGSIEPYFVLKGADRITILFGKKPPIVEAKEEKAATKEEVPKIEEKAEEKVTVEEEVKAEAQIAKAELAAAEAKPETKEAALATEEVKEEVKTETRAEVPKEEAKVDEAIAKPVEVADEVKPEVEKVEEKPKVEEAKAKVGTEIKEKIKEEVKAEEKTIAKEKAVAAPAVEAAVEEKAEPELVKKTTAEGASAEMAKAYNGQKVTLEFKDADLKNIFRIIAEVSGFNMIIDSAVVGKVTIRLVNVPWDQALDILLETNNLGMKKVGNVIRVLPAAVVKKEEEEKLASKKAMEKLEDMVTKLIPVSYATAADISSKLKGVMTDRGSTVVDDRTNTIILKDIQKSVDEAVKLVKDLDTPTPQVIIEARIVTANTNFARDLGVQWGAGFAADASHGNPTGYYFPNSYSVAGGGGGSFALNPPATGGVGASSGAGGVVGINFGSINNTLNLDLRLSALESQGWGKVVSSPKIITLDNKEASIQQGISIPFETTSASGTQTTFVDANLNLTVTPHVTADGRLMMKIKVTKNRPDLTFKGASGAPSIDKKEAITEILVKDGDTTVIGGIYEIDKSEKEFYTPFLGKIPILGWLFKSKSKSETKQELLIFITPKIARDKLT